MNQEQRKNKRMEYLDVVLYKYMNTEPKLTVEEIAFVICQQVCDKKLLKFIEKYKKELKS